VPSAPGIKSTKAKPGKKIQVKITAASDGGSPVTGYTARCTPKGSGKARSASGPRLTLTVTKLKAGTKYRCTVLAVNAVGASPWSRKGKTVTALE
jgi:hypothetical protein